MTKTMARKLARSYAKRVRDTKALAEVQLRHGELVIGAELMDKAQFFENLQRSYEKRS